MVMTRPTNYAIGLAVACALAALSGCVSAEKIHQPHDRLRDSIREGEFVQPGDQLVVVTADQRELVFRVTEVDHDAIHGAQVEVPIDEVVALEILDPEKPKSARMRTEVDSVGVLGAVGLTIFVFPAILLLVGIYL